MVRHRHVRHPTTAPCGMRGFIGQLTKSSVAVEAEAEAEDTRAATRIVIVHLEKIGEAAEAEMAEMDIVAVMVEDTRVTGLATTRMTTVDLLGSREAKQVMAAHVGHHHLTALLRFMVKLEILYD